MRLLWTGGWDSTFRLLDLVLVHRLPVRPYYVLDTARRSSIVELDTMRRIRLAIEAISTPAAALIAPSSITALHDVRPDERIAGQFRRLKARAFLGEQYEWLARFVAQSGLDGLELCVHVDDRAHEFLQGHVERAAGPGGGAWILREDAAAGDLSLFAPFRFPLLDLTKLDMQRLASQRGFLPVLEQTWFCFTPIRNKPCGLCNPCQYTIREGMARRVPLAGRVRYSLLPVLGPLRRAREKLARLRAGTRALRARPHAAR